MFCFLFFFSFFFFASTSSLAEYHQRLKHLSWFKRRARMCMGELSAGLYFLNLYLYLYLFNIHIQLYMNYHFFLIFLDAGAFVAPPMSSLWLCWNLCSQQNNALFFHFKSSLSRSQPHQQLVVIIPSLVSSQRTAHLCRCSMVYWLLCIVRMRCCKTYWRHNWRRRNAYDGASYGEFLFKIREFL